jgi:hypothetical protein
MRIDARLPLRFGTLADARDGDAILLSHGAPAPPGLPAAWLEEKVDTAAGHPAGCACCIPRNAAAQALSLLFLRRGRGEVAAFRTVLAAVGPADADLVRAALQSDPLVSGRFRLAQDA